SSPLSKPPNTPVANCRSPTPTRTSIAPSASPAWKNVSNWSACSLSLVGIGECDTEIVAAPKIILRVSGFGSENPCFHHLKNDLAKIFAGTHAPRVQCGFGFLPKQFQSFAAQCRQKLPS